MEIVWRLGFQRAELELFCEKSIFCPMFDGAIFHKCFLLLKPWWLVLGSNSDSCLEFRHVPLQPCWSISGPSSAAPSWSLGTAHSFCSSEAVSETRCSPWFHCHTQSCGTVLWVRELSWVTVPNEAEAKLGHKIRCCKAGLLCRCSTAFTCHCLQNELCEACWRNGFFFWVAALLNKGCPRTYLCLAETMKTKCKTWFH